MSSRRKTVSKRKTANRRTSSARSTTGRTRAKAASRASSTRSRRASSVRSKKASGARSVRKTSAARASTARRTGVAARKSARPQASRRAPAKPSLRAPVNGNGRSATDAISLPAPLAAAADAFPALFSVWRPAIAVATLPYRVYRVYRWAEAEAVAAAR